MCLLEGLVDKSVGFAYLWSHCVGVRGSNPDHGIIIGVFHSTKQLARFSHLNMPYIAYTIFSSASNENLHRRTLIVIIK